MRYPRSARRASGACAAAAATTVAISACAPSAARTTVPAPIAGPETGAFLVRLGDDTVAVERYTRTADRLEGDVVNRSPARIAHYVVMLGPAGLPTRAE